MTNQSDLNAFQAMLPKLLTDPAKVGQFALLHDGELADTFATFESAITGGYDRFGLDPFLVQPILENEEPGYFPRSLTRCHS